MVETVEITAVRKVFVDSRFWRFSRNSTGSSKCESNEQKKKPEKIETNILKRLPWSKPQIDSADDMIRSSSVSWGTCIRHLRRILFLAREKKWIWMSQLRPETQRPSFFHKMATSTDSLSEGRKKDACEIPPDKGIPGIPDLCSKHECRQDDFCDRLVSRRVNRRQREESRGILPKTCANRISC